MEQDEAPDLKKELQDLVTKTWVEDGLDVVVTSRPSGIVDVSQYVDKFVIMNLLPLSSEQQRRTRGALSRPTRSRRCRS